MKAEKAPVFKGNFGGQDKPDDNTKLIKRVTEHELMVTEMHLMIKGLRSQVENLEKERKEFKNKAELAFEILESVFHDANTGDGSLRMRTNNRIKELCS